MSSLEYYFGSLKKKKLINISTGTASHSNTITETIYDSYYDKFAFYYFIFGRKNKDYSEIEETAESNLPKEMVKFRQLLHPFRLTFLQVLYEEEEISSIDLRKRLDLSWTDFYNSLHSLQKKDLVTMNDEFDDNGYLRQHLLITAKGRNEYLEMINILDKFVELAKESIPDIDRDNIFSHFK